MLSAFTSAAYCSSALQTRFFHGSKQINMNPDQTAHFDLGQNYLQNRQPNNKHMKEAGDISYDGLAYV